MFFWSLKEEMKELPLRERILKYLRQQNTWINGGEIERLAQQAGYKASNASRRLRELHEDNLVEREERKGARAKTVWYRAKQATFSTYGYALRPDGERIAVYEKKYDN